MNRRVLWMFMCGLMMEVHGQDPLRRMDPDEWFQLEEVQDAWTILRGRRTSYSANVWCSSGALEMVGGSHGEAFGRVDDMRLILDANGQSIGRSHNHGFNLGARHFFHHDRRYALGGRGFWNAHAKLVEFVPSTGEWELQPCVNAPEHVMGGLTWYEEEVEQVVAIDPMDTDLPDWNKCRVVHALSMDSLTWRELGMVNKSLDVHFRDRATRAFDLPEHFVWLGLHKSIILRKRDMRAVLTTDFNRSSMASLTPFSDGSKGHLLTTVDSGFVRMVQLAGPRAQERILMEIDVAASFSKMEDEALDFVVPREHHAAPNPLENESSTPYGLLLLSAGFLLLGGYILGRGAKAESPVVKEAVPRPAAFSAEVSSSIDNFSLLTSRFILEGEGEMDTAKLNAFLGLDVDQSEETKRARRAQCIRDVNQEYKLVYGVELIHRKRDEADRRRTTYIIQPHSESA